MARRQLARRIALVVGSLVVVAALAVPLVTWIERSFLFHPHAAPTDDRVAQRTPALERWWLDTTEGPVEAFFVPGNGATSARPGPALIYAHGNAELIDPLPTWLARYRTMGISVLMPEYRGYGRSAGSPSERAIREDLVAWRDRLAARPEVDPSRIAYHGVSLGGGAVSQLARERPPAAIILQSTFTSVADIAYEMFRAPRFLVADPFDTVAALGGLQRPTLILHGTLDEVIPFAHAERLHREIEGSRLVHCNAGHNDLPPAELDYWGELERFLRDASLLR